MCYLCDLLFGSFKMQLLFSSADYLDPKSIDNSIILMGGGNIVKGDQEFEKERRKMISFY